MWIPDDSIPEVTIDVADDLSDRWSTDMSNMKGFSSIRTDIVDDNGLFLKYFSWLKSTKSSRRVDKLALALLSLIFFLISSSLRQCRPLGLPIFTYISK